MTSKSPSHRYWLWMLAAVLPPLLIFLLMYLFPAGLYKVFPSTPYLIFHTIVESLSIIISLQIFILAWVTYSKAKNPRSLFIGTSFLGVALLVSLHVLAYPDMPGGLVPVSIQKSLYYSLVARFWTIGALLAASFILVKKETTPSSPITPEKFSKLFFSRYFLLGTVLALVALVVGLEAIFGSYLPPLYIDGEGQTPLKIALEYGVMALALAAFVFYRKLYIKSQDRFLLYLMLGLIPVMASELCFTFYGSYTDTYIVLGHVYMIAAYALFFHALFIAEIRQPYLSLEAAHQSLRKSEEKYRQLIRSASDAIFLADAETGILLEANLKAEELIGLSREKIIGMHQNQLHSPEEAEFYRQRFQEAVAQEIGIISEETYIYHQDGRRIPVEISISAFELEGRKVIQGIFRDLTERQQAEKRIQREYDIKTVINSLLRLSLTPGSLEEVLKQTIDLLLSIPWLTFEKRGGIFLVEDDPQVLVLKTHEGFALPIQEACAQVSFGKCLCGKAALSQTIQFADALDAHHEISYEGIIPHGHYCIPVLSRGKVLGVINLYLQVGHQRDEDEITFLKSVANTLAGIIERKQAEGALSQSEARIRAVMDNVVDGIININERGLIETFNPPAEKIFGYTATEVLGKNVNILMPEPYRSEHNSYINNYLRTGQAKVLGKGIQEVVGQRKDGSTFPMELAPNEINVGGQRLFIGAVRDLTKHKQLEEQLRQSQKMEAVGTLAGGVAHDFNNLLTSMTINLELAKAKLIKGESHEAHLEEIDHVIQRAATLTRQLLAFSRRQIIQLVPLNLNETITGMSKMLPRLLGEHIKLDLHLDGNLAKVKADPGQIEQVIMNLCVNAHDAMPKGGTLTLKTQNVNFDESYIKNHPWAKAGDYVLLEVADTGAGMDKATLDRIFEPFFTTKEVGKGTGLGLSMVYGIIKQHQGYIDVYSEPGHGTIFKIYLPRTEEKVVTEKVEKAPKEVKGGKETILLAEDEEQLREAIQNILEMYGYTVLAAQDGHEAIGIYEREKERIGLVILDAVMPKMGGKEAADYIQKLNPRQKILFSSGYSADALHESFVIPAQMHFIQKPYRAKDLAQKVREVLEG